MYVIRRTQDRMFVAKPGSPYSYTNLLQKAKVFTDKLKANADLCIDNEYIETLNSALKTCY